MTGHRVLLVEDNPVNGKVAEKRLARLGVTVDVATDGAAAIARAGAGPYALVLMDLQLPDMGGDDAARAIRRLPGALGRVPIVALTAATAPDWRTRCVDAGMDDYLEKPLQQEALAAMLARWCDGVAAARPAAPSVDPAALQRLGDDGLARDALAAIVELFVGDTEQQLAELRAAVARADVKAMRDLAHRLKGASWIVGAAALSERCAVLEQQAAGGAVPAAADALAAIEAEFRRAVEELAAVAH
ncbi:MAG: response regulator [Gemmatimonadales bacterium]|nr:response regulator [Gemmatimonadales bacterium]